jgi:hypothetical protein
MKAFPLLLQALAAACALSMQWVGAQPPPPDPPAPPTILRVVEFANSITGRNVWLADAAEIAAVESGAAGPGWARNGYWFDTSNAHEEDRVDVCRFYAPASNSHFLTANAEECASLRANSTYWIYEKVPFRAHRPVPSGSCGLNVYRLYNNDMHNGAAHRFTTDRALRTRLAEEGWIDEGVAFCVDGSGRDTERSWVAKSTGEGPRADCDEPGTAVGTCVMIRALPPMTRALPFTNGDLGTGFYGDGTRFTSQPGDDPATLLANSFVEVSAPAGDAPEDFFKGRQFGFRLVGSNRVVGDLATLGVVHRLPTSAPVSAAQSDERVFPWGDGRERDLGLAFALRSWEDRYDDGPAQSYGLGVLRFQDRTTGRSLMVTLQVWGRAKPVNVVLRDVFTGQPIVSTYFGAAPAFGTTDSGGYVECPGPCIVSVRLGFASFAFRIARADFAKVIAMARQVDPGLSGDPASYLVSSFQFRGETHRGAAVGFAVDRLTLSLSR